MMSTIQVPRNLVAVITPLVRFFSSVWDRLDGVTGRLENHQTRIERIEGQLGLDHTVETAVMQEVNRG